MGIDVANKMRHGELEVDMTDIKENTHIVIKRDDAIKYLSEKQKHDLDSILLTINIRREKEGKSINNYLVINKDEPYAKRILQAIINEESRKQIK